MSLLPGPEEPYRDRCKNYVPTDVYLGHDGKSPPWLFELNRLPERRELVPVTWGRADELNRDKGTWDWADVSGDGSHWSHFEGHREQVDVSLTTYNERVTNDWKGRDEIRAYVHWTVSLDRVQVGEGTTLRDPFEAMLQARDHARRMSMANMSIPSINTWRDAHKLVGLPIFYRDQPAIIHSMSCLDQGCLVIRPDLQEMPGYFRPPAWADGHDDYWGEPQLKVDILSDHIWWYRDRKSLTNADPTASVPV